MDIAQLKQRLTEPKSQRRFALVFAVLLLVLLVLLIWNNVQDIWFPEDNSSPPTAVNRNYTGPSADIIPSLHLFGSSATDLGDLPLASLGLQVNGIFMSNTASKSRALIGMTGQAPQMYNVGDMLPGNVKIFKITHDSVIVSHNNRLEKLPFALQGIDFSQTSNHQGLFN